VRILMADTRQERVNATDLGTVSRVDWAAAAAAAERAGFAAAQVRVIAEAGAPAPR
jgi:hypothetical protein